MSERRPVVPCKHEYPHVSHKHRNPGNDGPIFVRCPGVAIARNARRYMPAVRRSVLADLRKVAKYLGYTIGAWHIYSQVWENGAGGFARPRRVEEYPENSVEAWRELRGDCDHLIAHLSMLREAADKAAERLDLIERAERRRGAQQLDEAGQR